MIPAILLTSNKILVDIDCSIYFSLSLISIFKSIDFYFFAKTISLNKYSFNISRGLKRFTILLYKLILKGKCRQYWNCIYTTI